LEIEDGKTGEIYQDYAEILINATGWLKYTKKLSANYSSWKWPDIKGLHDFQGALFHTANWEEDYSVQGKRVAVIGSGSSAIQVVPQLQPRNTSFYGSNV
jgi:cation diffusion facilitator CzcD-associated flavoprotein CzcO